jgi:hypothetical protein
VVRFPAADPKPGPLGQEPAGPSPQKPAGSLLLSRPGRRVAVHAVALAAPTAPESQRRRAGFLGERLSSRERRATLPFGASAYFRSSVEATMRQRWNPIPPMIYGLASGIFAGVLIIMTFEGGDLWQDQAGVLLEITMATTLASMAVSYVRQSISN